LDIQCECEDPVNFIECVDNLKRIVKGDRATT
jgi:hypothetical protein